MIADAEPPGGTVHCAWWSCERKELPLYIVGSKCGTSGL